MRERVKIWTESNCIRTLGPTCDSHGFVSELDQDQNLNFFFSLYSCSRVWHPNWPAVILYRYWRWPETTPSYGKRSTQDAETMINKLGLTKLLWMYHGILLFHKLVVQSYLIAWKLCPVPVNSDTV